MDTETETLANVSFAGCGFIGIYHVGVSACLKRHAPHLLQNKIGGSSAGAMAAVALICDLSLVDVTRGVAMLAHTANQKVMRAFNPTFSLHDKLKSMFVEIFPDDVAERARGRLFVSMTRASNKSNILVSDFRDKEDVIEAVCASSFVPMMSGWFPPRFRGELALDGGYSDNIPDLGGRTITVSPFSGDASICPAEHASSQLWSVPHGSGGSVHLSKENLFKLGNAMVPPDTRKMQTICAQGFSDAMSYLQSSEEIKCGQCETEICDMCTLKRSEASDQVLPSEITEVFDEIMELEANRKSSGSCILSLPSLLVSSVVQESGRQRLAVTRLLRTYVASALSLLSHMSPRPSIASCPFVNL